MEYQYDEVWGIRSRRAAEFFTDAGGTAGETGSRFTFENAEVILEPQPDRKLGSLLLPGTRIKITGDGADELYHKFWLKFLSVGG